MKAVILAAGKGSRLGGLTSDLPKSLLYLNEQHTLLDYNIAVLKKIGIEDIIIITGFNSDKIEKHLEGQNIKFIYNPFWNSCNVLGSFYFALPFLNDNFLFLHADTLVEIKVWKNLLNSKSNILLPFKKKICGEEEMKIKVDFDGKLICINKSMKPSEAIGEFLGIAKFSKKFIKKIKFYSEMLFKNGELNSYMESILQLALEDGEHIDLLDIEDAKFIEVDFLDDYNEAKIIFNSII